MRGTRIFIGVVWRRVERRRKDASSLGHDGKDAASSLAGYCLLLGPFSVLNAQVVFVQGKEWRKGSQTGGGRDFIIAAVTQKR